MACATLFPISFLVVLSCLPVDAKYLRSEPASPEDVESQLLEELIKSWRADAATNRLSKFKAQLTSGPMYTALPKSTDGRMDHGAVRYMLHRFFVHQHGWYVRGLEPAGDSWNSSALDQSLKKWAPPALLDKVQQMMAMNGLKEQQIVLLATTIEHLVHNEAIVRLRTAYNSLGVPTTEPLTGDLVQDVIDAFMMSFLTSNEITVLGREDLKRQRAALAKDQTEWIKMEEWLVDMKARNLNEGASGQYTFETMSKLVEEVGEQYATVNDRECAALKKTLMEMEDRKAGRVTLHDFYRKGLYTFWEFDEKIDYLRALGALDESTPEKPMVIIPNYLSARPNCLAPSSFFAICCRVECEDLMDQIEREVKGPAASPDQVVKIIESLASDTVKAPRKISTTLLRRLDEVAAQHEGKIPIFGRLFSQWMHHAFPRECPYPHEAGTTNPQTPDEWMEQTGETSTKATEEERMQCVANMASSTPDGEHQVAVSPEGAEELAGVEEELPWSSAEELEIMHMPPEEPPAAGVVSQKSMLCGAFVCLLIISLKSNRGSRSMDSSRYLSNFFDGQKMKM